MLLHVWHRMNLPFDSLAFDLTPYQHTRRRRYPAFFTADLTKRGAKYCTCQRLRMITRSNSQRKGSLCVCCARHPCLIRVILSTLHICVGPSCIFCAISDLGQSLALGHMLNTRKQQQTPQNMHTARPMRMQSEQGILPPDPSQWCKSLSAE